jgi:MoxR-like ATPase
MQEESVTVDGISYPLPQPFFVVATQNPPSFAGSFLLPEGEIDRFGISFSIGYPSSQDEKEILQRFQEENPMENVEPVMNSEEVKAVRKVVRKVFVSEEVKDFIIDIVDKTRTNKAIQLGASPRASQHLQRAAQGRALIEGREFVIPEDIIAMAAPVLAHRLILSAEAKAAYMIAQSVIEEILKGCKVPIGL